MAFSPNLSDEHRAMAAWRCFRDLAARRSPGADDVGASAEVLRRHGLGPRLYVGGQPDFRADYVATMLRAEKRRACIDEVTAALGDHGIEVALLKGMSYVGDLYQDPAVRPMGDIDILVRDETMEPALAVLESLGFTDGTPGGRTPYHHAWQLFRGDQSIDLHRNIVQPARAAIDLDAVWRRARETSRGESVKRLAPIDELLFHLAHIGRSELWAPLVSYFDALLLMDRLNEQERDQLWRRAQAFRIHRLCLAAHAMAEQLAFSVALDLPRWARAMPSPIEIILADCPERWQQLKRKLALVDGLRGLGGLGGVYVARRMSALWARR